MKRKGRDWMKIEEKGLVKHDGKGREGMKEEGKRKERRGDY